LYTRQYNNELLGTTSLAGLFTSVGKLHRDLRSFEILKRLYHTTNKRQNRLQYLGVTSQLSVVKMSNMSCRTLVSLPTE